MDREYLVVLPVEPIQPGVEYRGSLPLHCTVMPWFRLGNGVNEKDLSNALKVLAGEADGLELVSKRAELFGPRGDIAVQVLSPSAQLSKLHTQLHTFLAQKDSLPDHRRWIGVNYRPHVSDSGGHSFTSGSHRTPKKLILIERWQGAKHFKEAYSLGHIRP